MPKKEPKRLYRSKIDRKIAGVCGGIAEYFNVDPTVVRLIWIICTLVTMIWAGILAYIIGWIIIPENPKQQVKKESKSK